MKTIDSNELVTVTGGVAVRSNNGNAANARSPLGGYAGLGGLGSGDQSLALAFQKIKTDLKDLGRPKEDQGLLTALVLAKVFSEKNRPQAPILIG